MARKVFSEDDAAQVGAALKKARESRNLTTTQLGRMIGSSGRAVWAIEAGTSAPSIAAVFELARALNASWTEILGPAPGTDDGWQDGYRAGLADATTAVRELLESERAERRQLQPAR